MSPLPNDVHGFFAAHLMQGGRHVTANFDCCIEACLPASFDLADRLWHFHGSLAQDDAGNSLGATLAAIEKGFDGDTELRFQQVVSSGEVLVVFGYSGSDFFDVDPAIAALPQDALKGKRVLWIAHAAEGSTPREPDERDPPLLSLFASSGAEVTVLCAPTAEVCADLARRWTANATARVATADTHPDRSPSAARSTLPALEAGARQTATIELLRELRLHREVAARLRSHGWRLPAGDRWRARADLLWQQGRFKTAMVGWLINRSGVEAWERHERIGATLWEQGRLLPAWLWLTFYRRRYAPGVEWLRLLETEGRVVLRMCRTPDLRWLGRLLAPSIQRELGTTGREAGLHMYLRARDVSALLGTEARSTMASAPLSHESEGERWFLEAGDLTGVLAYRHSRYRQTYQDDLPLRTLVSRYLTQERDKELVGSSGVRTRQLPGSERVWSFRQYVLSLLEVQYGWWHRLRLLGVYAVVDG